MKQTNAKTELTLEIDALAYGPYGIGRLEGKVIMVPNTAPGDTILASIVESKERYAIAKLDDLIQASSLRQNPPCRYVGECGGCSWQHLRYEAQLKAKQQSVEDALRRIGKLQDFELRSIIPSQQEYHYRRRIRLHSDANKQLGFFRAFSHELVGIDSCLIADPKLNEVIEPLRRWIKDVSSPIEYLEIVTGDEPNQTVVVGKLAAQFLRTDAPTCIRFIEQTPNINGLIIHNANWRKTWGQTIISVSLEPGLSLKLDADVFTQVNSDENRQILSELLAAGEFKDEDRILELYAGAGNFTLPVAKRVREVTAVEGSRLAVDSGKRSAQVNNLKNIQWIASAVPPALQRFHKRSERFSKIILDPPRTGAKGIDSDLASLGAERIFYISCNPTTLARDLAALAKQGYKLSSVQPIDLFPHTFHVEALAVLNAT